MRRYLFSFAGRINRAKAWLFFSLLVIADWVLAGTGRLVMWIGDMLDTNKVLAVTDDIVMVLVYVVGAALNVSLISFAVRRLHDRDKSGWWVLGYAVTVGVCAFGSNELATSAYENGQAPSDAGMWLMVAAFAVAVWLLVELLVLHGTDGPNRYGPDPLTGRA